MIRFGAVLNSCRTACKSAHHVVQTTGNKIKSIQGYLKTPLKQNMAGQAS